MDLLRGVGCRGRQEDLRGSREPSAPVRARLLPLDRGVGPSRRGARTRRRASRVRAPRARPPKGSGACLAVPVFVGPEWWGFLGFDDARDERTWSEVEIGALRAAAGALGDRDRAPADGGDPPLHRAAVPIDRRAHPGDHLYRRGRTSRRRPSTSARRSSGARLLATGMARRSRAVAEDLHPDDRARALAENARHNETGEPFSLEYRMFAQGRAAWCGCTTRPRWSETTAACRGSPTA